MRASNEKAMHTVPEFVSKATDQIVNEGDTIKLPCYADNMGKNLTLNIRTFHGFVGAIKRILLIQSTFLHYNISSFSI